MAVLEDISESPLETVHLVRVETRGERGGLLKEELGDREDEQINRGLDTRNVNVSRKYRDI